MPVSTSLSVAALLPVARAPVASVPVAGQVIEGRSLGQNAEGQTLFAVGRQVLNLDLPQRPPAGTPLRLAVEQGPNGQQLTLLAEEPGVPVPLPPATKAALFQLLLANAGKALEARVLGSNAEGTSRVAFGQIVVDLDLPEPFSPGTLLRFAVSPNGSGVRLPPGSQPTPTPLPMAVAPQSQLHLVRLNLKPGQVLTAQVLTNLPSGESEISLNGQKLVVSLPQSLPAGARIEVEVQPQGAGIRLALVPQAAPEPAPQPPSPLQSLLEAATRAALADQDTLAPALATLNRLLAHSAGLPPPVARAAQVLLATQLALDDGVSGEQLRQAILQSGVFAEPSPGAKPDIQTALLQLRGTLLAWLGPDATAPGGNRRPVPPTRGGQPRAQMPVSQPLDGEMSAGQLARALLGETGAALHRLRLFQLAALPDAPATGGADKPSQVLVEIPVRLGQETSMAQFQVGRDGGNGGGPHETRRGWQMRFSINFSVLGEVGAQIGLLSRKVNIAIWAERQATAEVLEQMLPEVTQALAAKGIETVSVQCRQGIPKAPNPPPAGLYVDAVR